MKKLLSLMLVLMLAFNAPAASYASDVESVTLAGFLEEYGGEETQPEVVEDETLPEEQPVFPADGGGNPWGGASYITSTDGLFEYTADGVLTGYLGDGPVMNIPANIDGTAIVTIGDGAATLLDRNVVTDIIIPSSVVTIEDFALSNVDTSYYQFYELYDNPILNTVTINGSNLTNIGSYAFAHNFNLEVINIPSSVTGLGDYAFYYCNGLESIDLTGGITEINAFTFYECKSLTSVILPGNLTTIGEYAFDSSGLTSVTLPGSLTTIGNYAFRNCPFTSITFPAGLTTISDYAFAGSSLTSLICPDGLTTIGAFAFSNCKSLASIKLSDNLEVMGEQAFGTCTSLTSVDFGSGLTYISDLAFASCTALATIEFPANIKRIGAGAFYFTDSLKTVTVPASIETVGNSVFGESGLTSVVLNNTIVSRGMFIQCLQLTDVELGNNIREIGESAFYNCTALKSIRIPDSVTSIETGDYSEPFIKEPSVTLYGSKGSYAEGFADTNGYNFIYDETDAYIVTFASEDDTDTGSYVQADVTGLNPNSPPIRIASGTPVQGGREIVFKLSTYADSDLKYWSLNGTPVASENNAYTLKNLSEDVLVFVSYTDGGIETTHTVTFGVTGSNGTLSAKVDDAAVSSPASVVAGKNVVFTAVPASGYRVKEWKSDGEVVVGNTGNEYTLVNVSAAITVTVEFEEIPDVDGKNGFHEEDEDLWYYYIDGVKQYTEGGFFTAEDALRYFRVGGALGFGFEPLADGKWTYILDAGIPAEPGFYDTGDGYWRAIGENGYMLEAGLYSFDGLWRYILNGAIVAPVDWYDDLAGERRYVANGGILLSPGWHFIDGADRYILDGSIPAVGEMEIDGVTYIFDEYGKPIN